MKDKHPIKQIKKARREKTKDIDLRTRVSNTENKKKDSRKHRREFKERQEHLNY